MPWPKVQRANRHAGRGLCRDGAGRRPPSIDLPVEALEVNDLEVEHVLALDGQTRITTQLTHGADGNHVEIHASSGGGNWSRYAVATIEVNRQDVPAAQSDIATGTEIVLPDDAVDHPGYRIHPALLDAALQQLAAAIPAESADAATRTSYLPVSLATIRVFGPIRHRARCHVDLVEQGAGHYRGRIVLSDDNGSSDRGTHRHRVAAGRSPARCLYRWRRRYSTLSGCRARRPGSKPRPPPAAGCC